MSCPVWVWTYCRYLKSVDKHNEWTVSAFLATNGMWPRKLELMQVKLILLHDMKNDDGIRLFFGDVWELYTKVSLFAGIPPGGKTSPGQGETNISAESQTKSCEMHHAMKSYSDCRSRSTRSTRRIHQSGTRSSRRRSGQVRRNTCKAEVVG